MKAVDRRQAKRKNEIEEMSIRREQKRKRRNSFIKFPAGVKDLTKANRRLSRGRGLPRHNESRSTKNNQGYKFDPSKGPIINFGREVAFTAKKKRPIAMDGSNIAFEHGKQTHRGTKWFSARGIKIAVDYFKKKGHEVKCFVPKHRMSQRKCDDPELLRKLNDEGTLILTPDRNINGQRYTSYDDRMIVQYAAASGAVIVSNDNYRDLMDESMTMNEAITYRHLQFNFVGDLFMVPSDPMGRNGPHLNDFLCF